MITIMCALKLQPTTCNPQPATRNLHIRHFPALIECALLPSKPDVSYINISR